MPLCVIGNVDEQSCQGCRHSLSSHGARCFQVCRGEGAHPGGGIGYGGPKLAQQLLACRSGIEFLLQKSDLSFAEISAFSVGQQSIEAAGHVPNVKGKWGRCRGPGVECGVGEVSAPFEQIFFGQFQSVQHSASDRGDVGACAS